MITSIIIMILSGAALYIYTKWLLQNEIEEELYSEKNRVEHLLEQNPELVGIPPIITAEKTEIAQPNILVDTLIYDPLQDEIELFRQLSGTKNINGQNYMITVRAMTIESENILFAILFTFLVVILLAFIFLFYLNKSRNEKLWKPFFVNLDRLKSFSLRSNQPLSLEDSEILEFHELNREMEDLTAKIQIDYRNLKQFTEDISHEMQTPLAIMQAKIETIINDIDINEAQFNEFSSLQTDIGRLKKLNKKLILLAKIENNQFTGTETTSINTTFKETIQNIQELAAINIKLKEENTIEVPMDGSLARVLCNNLVSNAVKHNSNNQPVLVVIKDGSVLVINSGTEVLERPDQVFERFYKESKKRDSTGLGLSIVKKICDYYGFTPSYRFENNKHIFQVHFVV
ncbi:hypothetical protein SAMN05444483_11330 [Salegentibacter echinorum]|uniref:histidine kinase n=1 Tax=Salegentibacter echinorum TaxID=1073325 RepID=A0A1M5K3B6_SALEC|nr:HAMP domain-containing sensor histidine kinase [Salegentibacter echinorum]SHG47241.1 hypothetical protein SAMN05444483_11330 [Salegentibacter echinorum]